MENLHSTNQLFIGMDVHKKNWSICIRSKELEHRTFQMEGKIELLEHYVRKNFSNHSVIFGYEASGMGYWIQKSLEDHGYRCVILNPADIPGTDKESKRKSDKSDCRKIARALCEGHQKGIYIPSDDQIAFRCMFRKRNMIVKELRRIKCRIKSHLLFHGVSIPSEYDRNSWSRNFLCWLEGLNFNHQMSGETLRSHLRHLKYLHEEFLHLERELRQYARKNHKIEYYRFRSVPGIGPLVAIALISEVGDLSRFNNIDQLCSYIGLVPNIYQSGDKERNKGLTYRSKLLLRSYLIESSWIAARHDPELMNYFTDRVKRMNANKVIVKIARKLVNRLYYMTKYSRNYQVNINNK